MTKSIVFVGDICLAGRPSGTQSPRMPALAQALRSVVPEPACLVGTVEAPISGRGSPKPHKACLRADPRALSLLAGFDIGLLGNNHIEDFGAEAAMDTRSGLLGIGCRPVGYGANLAQALEPAILDLGDVKVAIISLCCMTTRADGFATDRSPGVAPLSLQLMREAISRARQHAELVVVCPHWGIQGAELPVLDDLLLARAAVESGASAVIGTHAHIIQAVEVYQGAPIAYGLGNYLFDDVDAPYVDHYGRETGVRYRVSQSAANRKSLVIALRPERKNGHWQLEISGRWIASQAEDLSISHERVEGGASADRSLISRLACLPVDLSARAEPVYLSSVRDGVIVYNHRSPSLDRTSFVRAMVVRLVGVARVALRRLR